MYRHAQTTELRERCDAQGLQAPCVSIPRACPWLPHVFVCWYGCAETCKGLPPPWPSSFPLSSPTLGPVSHSLAAAAAAAMTVMVRRTPCRNCVSSRIQVRQRLARAPGALRDNTPISPPHFLISDSFPTDNRMRDKGTKK